MHVNASVVLEIRKAEQSTLKIMSRVRNDLFDPKKGFERGRSRAFFALWYCCKVMFFLTAIPWPSQLKRCLLRVFGARIGRGVIIKPRVNVHFPWKLSVGDHSWVGEEVSIVNFEPVSIGAHVCVSQRVFICAGNHDFRDLAMAYRNAPIDIKDGAWIAAQVFVGPGVVIGEDAVVTAACCIVRDVEPGGVARPPTSVISTTRWPGKGTTEQNQR
jgi:putative colanic acid biosynthesis acetyltransferase WcaF